MEKYISTYKICILVEKISKEHNLTPFEAARYVINCGINLEIETPIFFKGNAERVVVRPNSILAVDGKEDFYLGVFDCRSGCFFEFGNSRFNTITITTWPVSEEGQEFYKKYMMEEL